MLTDIYRRVVREMPRIANVDLRWDALTVRCASPQCLQRPRTRLAFETRFRGVCFQDRWYHQSSCLNETLLAVVKQLLPGPAGRRVHFHRIPIGLLLVKRGVITPEQLREALRLQRQAGSGKLGYWLQQFTSITEEELCAALGQQWGCPVFPLNSRTFLPVSEETPPYPILFAAKAVPVYTGQDGRLMHIAFSEGIDHSLLYVLERVMGCRTIPCIASQSAVAEALEHVRKHAAGNEICFDSVRDPAEIAATSCSYAAQMDIREMKIVSAAGFLWVAFFRQGTRRDLLFRVPASASGRAKPFLDHINVFPEIADKRRDGVVGATVLL